MAQPTGPPCNTTAGQFARHSRPPSSRLWSFLNINEIEPTNYAAERALRQPVIQRKITGLPGNSRSVRSRQGAICRNRLLTVTSTLRQQGRAVWQLLEEAWNAHHRGGLMPSLKHDPSSSDEHSGMESCNGATRPLNTYHQRVVTAAPERAGAASDPKVVCAPPFGDAWVTRPACGKH